MYRPGLPSGTGGPDAPTGEFLEFLKVSGQPYMHGSSLVGTNGNFRVYGSWSRFGILCLITLSAPPVLSTGGMLRKF